MTVAQALLVSNDIIKDILSFAAFVANMPYQYQKGYHHQHMDG